MSLLDKIKSDIVESHVWKAIFRHGYEDTPRNRVMMVTANVFLHLHPAKVRRHADPLIRRRCGDSLPRRATRRTLSTSRS